MIRYDQSKEKSKQFLAATRLTVVEIQRILLGLTEKLASLHPPELTERGTPRQRLAGAGPKEKLRTNSDELMIILIYQKTYPTQEMLGLQIENNQPQANYLIHLLLLILGKRRLNSIISGTIISVENTIAGVKRCRIVKDVFRNTKDGFSDLVIEVACALHNLRFSYANYHLLLITNMSNDICPPKSRTHQTTC